MFSGKIAESLRSTMSIPGVFAPVKTHGMVLVDGGMRDNYPIASAREVGADIVIGVELGDARKGYDQINNIGDIISQGIDMLGKPSVEAKRKIWMDKLPSLTEDDADMLSGTFDFSGGEIDNIVRKATMQEVLEGTVPDIATMMQLCREEKFSRNSKETTRKIGF